MPQFDQFSFFTQSSWFLFFLFTFYFIFVYYFLPIIFLNVKSRKKKILFSEKNKNKINIEKVNTIIFYNKLNKTFFSKFDCFFCAKKTINEINNKNYNNFLINICLKQNIELLLNNNFIFLKKIFI
jgi:hypothetical protein